MREVTLLRESQRVSEMDKKLIVPAEVKVCATCSYWDGERHVDEEYNLVVVSEECRGECLAQERTFKGLHDVRHTADCAWEPLVEDAEAETADASSVPRKIG